MSPQNYEVRLGEIDAHAEAVAVATPAGSHLNELAYAVHNLCVLLRDLTDEVERLKRS